MRPCEMPDRADFHLGRAHAKPHQNAESAVSHVTMRCRDGQAGRPRNRSSIRLIDSTGQPSIRNPKRQPQLPPGKRVRSNNGQRGDTGEIVAVLWRVPMAGARRQLRNHRLDWRLYYRVPPQEAFRLPEGLPVSMCSRRRRHGLAMNPDRKRALGAAWKVRQASVARLPLHG